MFGFCAPTEFARQHWIQQTFFSLPLTSHHNHELREQPMVTPKLPVLLREGVGKRGRESKREGGGKREGEN